MSDFEAEFSAGKHKYRATRLSVFDAMDVASDYRDILIALATMRQERPPDLPEADYVKAINFIMTARAGATPEARARARNTCLKTVSRQSTGWSPILASDDNLAFADIELPDVCKIMYKVFEHNKLLDFFSESPSDSPGTAGNESGQPSDTAKTG